MWFQINALPASFGNLLAKSNARKDKLVDDLQPVA